MFPYGDACMSARCRLLKPPSRCVLLRPSQLRATDPVAAHIVSCYACFMLVCGTSITPGRPQRDRAALPGIRTRCVRACVCMCGQSEGSLAAKVVNYPVGRHNLPGAHAVRAIEPLLKPTMPSAMHVLEGPCEDTAIRLPMTPSPPTSSSSCCPSLDSSGLCSTTSGRKVIGRIKLSTRLHSDVGTVKSPVELPCPGLAISAGPGAIAKGWLHCSPTRWSTSSRDGSAGPAPV